MHHTDHNGHKQDTIGHVHIGDHHVLEKHFRATKMAVHDIIWALQNRSIHAVKCVESTVKSSTEITQMPHPAKHRRYVNITCTEAKNGEEYGQYGTKKDGKLKEHTYISYR